MYRNYNSSQYYCKNVSTFPGDIVPWSLYNIDQAMHADGKPKDAILTKDSIASIQPTFKDNVGIITIPSRELILRFKTTFEEQLAFNDNS